VGFEHTITASKRVKTINALKRSATVTGWNLIVSEIQVGCYKVKRLCEAEVIVYRYNAGSSTYRILRTISVYKNYIMWIYVARFLF
jgi:hypothetical protein